MEISQYCAIFENLYRKYQSQKEEPVGVIVSGGIDSSIIAYYVNQYFPEAKFISLMTEKSQDRSFVKILSKYLRQSVVLVETKKTEIQNLLPEIKELLKSVKVEVNPMQLALGIGFYLLSQQAQQLGLKYLFTGQGPDILLAGYHKYKIQNSKTKTIKEMIREDLAILEIDKRRDGVMAKKWGITLINPYLEKEFIKFALNLEEKWLINEGREKYLSRLVAKQLRLPEEIVWRPKKALQYSTGIQKLILELNQRSNFF
jgi:asparagine synthase (glutamine-hydrolysing)